MKFQTIFLSLSITAPAMASIPYCSYIEISPKKHHAIQSVIQSYALMYHCTIGKNCISSLSQPIFSISWAKKCPDSATGENTSKKAYIICQSGLCHPLGLDEPNAFY